MLIKASCGTHHILCNPIGLEQWQMVEVQLVAALLEV